MGEHPGDILHQRNPWTERSDEKEESLVKLVARISRRINSATTATVTSRGTAITKSPELTTADLAPALTRGAADYDVEGGLKLPLNHPSLQLVRSEAGKIPEQCLEPMLDKIGFQRFDSERAMVNRNGALVAGPMKAERKTSGSRKQVEHGRNGGVSLINWHHEFSSPSRGLY
jgi:hypothetical protein